MNLTNFAVLVCIAIGAALVASAVALGADKLTIVLAIGGGASVYFGADKDADAGIFLGLLAVIAAIFFAFCVSWWAPVLVLVLAIVTACAFGIGLNG